MSGWSAQQAQWLHALGHPVLVRREADWPAGALVASVPAEAAAGGAVRKPDRRAPSGEDFARPAARPPEAGVRPAHRDAPERPDTDPDRVPPPAREAAPPRADTSAKLVAISQARRERDFGNARFAPLLANLMRAASLEGDAGRERLRALEVELSALHRDPSAKRALWPVLRRLRREPRQ